MFYDIHMFLFTLIVCTRMLDPFKVIIELRTVCITLCQLPNIIKVQIHEVSHMCCNGRI